MTEGLKSKHTKIAHRIAFNHFLDITIKSKAVGALLNTKQNVVESRIIDHITYLKDVEGLTYRSILVHLSAIFHFFEINDYDDLRRRKIKRFLPEDESVQSPIQKRRLNRSYQNVTFVPMLPY